MEKLSEDILHGARDIGEYVGIDERKAYYWLEKGYLPGKKIGNAWSSTKSRLRRHFEGQEVPQNAPAPPELDGRQTARQAPG